MGSTVLYSIQYMRNRTNWRQLFYADNDEAALEKIKAYAKKNELIYELLHFPRQRPVSPLWTRAARARAAYPYAPRPGRAGGDLAARVCDLCALWHRVFSPWTLNWTCLLPVSCLMPTRLSCA